MADAVEEFLDVSGTNNWIYRVFGDISRESALKQVGVGSVSGMLAGFLFIKVGRVAAATMGSTILLLQLAQHQGYIEIDWARVRQDTRRAQQRMRHVHYPGTWQNICEFVQANVFLAVGFGGGFLIGMTF
ncbi:hypothetical protein BaRGS_00019413 [Batillaria attramentaria]|uniref:Uncharacterized protein n=1 Tax=Batillaria attramentaria TaxID=370345 RepID=A0ABD0KQD1_9CAEN